MHIKILGTRGEIKPTAPYHSRHSGVLVNGKVLLDIGEKEFLKYHPESIFITHLHPDHAFFVTEPAGDTGIPVYAPEKSKDYPGITVIESMIEMDGLTITPVPTHHSKLVRSCGYLIEGDKHKLLYTGDLIWINKEYHHILEHL